MRSIHYGLKPVSMNTLAFESNLTLYVQMDIQRFEAIQVEIQTKSTDIFKLHAQAFALKQIQPVCLLPVS